MPIECIDFRAVRLERSPGSADRDCGSRMSGFGRAIRPGRHGGRPFAARREHRTARYPRPANPISAIRTRPHGSRNRDLAGGFWRLCDALSAMRAAYGSPRPDAEWLAGYVRRYSEDGALVVEAFRISSCAPVFRRIPGACPAGNYRIANSAASPTYGVITANFANPNPRRTFPLTRKIRGAYHSPLAFSLT
jgi:hypothetical protein